MRIVCGMRVILFATHLYIKRDLGYSHFGHVGACGSNASDHGNKLSMTATLPMSATGHMSGHLILFLKWRIWCWRFMQNQVRFSRSRSSYRERAPKNNHEKHNMFRVVLARPTLVRKFQ